MENIIREYRKSVGVCPCHKEKRVGYAVGVRQRNGEKAVVICEQCASTMQHFPVDFFKTIDGTARKGDFDIVARIVANVEIIDIVKCNAELLINGFGFRGFALNRMAVISKRSYGFQKPSKDLSTLEYLSNIGALIVKGIRLEYAVNDNAVVKTDIAFGYSFDKLTRKLKYHYNKK